LGYASRRRANDASIALRAILGSAAPQLAWIVPGGHDGRRECEPAHGEAVCMLKQHGLLDRKLAGQAVCLGMILIAVAGCGGAGGAAPKATDTIGALAGSVATPTAPSTVSFPDLIDRVRSGVVRIEVETCNGSGIGTGIVLGPRHVATVEHVIDGATVIRIKRGGRVLATARVIGFDKARDVALLRTNKLVTGYRFELARRGARLGDAIAALGFPLGLPLTVTRGSVSGLNRTIPIEGVNRRRLVQTDAALNPGNSGGPLIAVETGDVVGLVDLGLRANGLAFAVSAQVARLLLKAWQASPQPTAAPSCASPPPPPPAPAPPPAPSAPRSGVPAIFAGHFASVDGREQCYADGKGAVCSSLISRETVSVRVGGVAFFVGKISAGSRGARMPERTSFTTPNGLISCESGRFGIHCVDNTQADTGFYLGDRYARLINHGRERRI
jgi:hypothetical protein